MDALNKIRDNLIEQDEKKRKDSAAFYVVFLVLLFLTVLVIHLNLFVFMNIEVYGSSMESTLQSGDNLIAIRNAKVNRGDIIIINKRTHDTAETGSYYIIKRVIGIGGDVVKIENGKVYLNGTLLDESYLDSEQTTKNYDVNTRRCDSDEPQVYTLSYDEIFYLGDNRVNSTDARVNGPCKNSDVMGVVTNFSVRNRKSLSAVFKFFRRVSELFSGASDCGGKRK